MNIKISNKCKRNYWPNPVKAIEGTLGKVPNKFLDGLSKIEIFDDSSNDSISKYESASSASDGPTIKMCMGPQSFLGLISVGYLNTLLLLSVSNHITEHLKPNSKDFEILNHKPNTFNPKWIYWGTGPYIYERIPEKRFCFC